MKIKISLKSPKNYESNTNTNTTNYNLIEKEKQFLLLQDLISSKKQILIDYQSQFNNTLMDSTSSCNIRRSTQRAALKR